MYTSRSEFLKDVRTCIEDLAEAGVHMEISHIRRHLCKKEVRWPSTDVPPQIRIYAEARIEIEICETGDQITLIPQYNTMFREPLFQGIAVSSFMRHGREYKEVDICMDNLHVGTDVITGALLNWWEISTGRKPIPSQFLEDLEDYYP
jgi:hypothetical protein